MIAIDTNVLVRIFIDDLNQTQVNKSRELVQKAKHIHITQIVLIELIWVLSRAYQLEKSKIISILQEIYENAAFVVEQKEQLLEALTLYKNHSVDFSDCMILAATKKANVDHVYTFDAKFARLPGVKKL